MMDAWLTRLCVHFYENGSRGKGLFAKKSLPPDPYPQKLSTFGGSRWSPRGTVVVERKIFIVLCAPPWHGGWYEIRAVQVRESEPIN
jgi:hypothetical protein